MNKKIWKTNPGKTRRKQKICRKLEELNKLKLILIMLASEKEHREIYERKKERRI